MSSPPENITGRTKAVFLVSSPLQPVSHFAEFIRMPYLFEGFIPYIVDYQPAIEISTAGKHITIVSDAHALIKMLALKIVLSSRCF